MALAIDSTVGGTESNSYVSLTYANSYWADHYNSTKAAQWAALNDAKKTTLLIHACAVIEGIRFTKSSLTGDYRRPRHFLNRNTGLVQPVPEYGSPVKYDVLQRLQFPRNLDIDDSGVKFIPEPVLMAQCEQALFLLTADESVAVSRMQGVLEETVKAGPVSVSQKFASAEGAPSVQFAPPAVELLRPFFCVGSKLLRS